ncbi:ras-related protein rab-5c [Anaeramoeba flamelloides]|uniref:Ras-related protein rab-5c n=1 Tax=Anaeramoeba flamelloides TaxID=1746091 RepID=A0ABQ8ZFJ5_9EUKA|nr:ras-related protein rab-5c [Anaeramoeba flamelloides]
MSNISEFDSSDDETIRRNVIKIVMLGQTGCGKTSIVIRYIDDNFTENTSTTIGAAFFLKTLKVDEQSVFLRLWDTSGQERFKSLVPLYYRHAAGAVLVFDPQESLSFDKLKYWHNELQNNCDNVPVMAIVANKIDLFDKKGPEMEMIEKAKKYANKIGSQFFEASAKTGQSIEELFGSLVREILEKRKTMKEFQQPIDEWFKPQNDEDINNFDDQNQSGGSCC